MILGIGPILHTVELGMVDVVQWLIGLPLGLGGFVIGASYPLMVLIGIHHTLTMVETSLLANAGFMHDYNMCHVWVCQRWQLFSFCEKAQDSKVKSTAIGSMLSQLFGVSEPVLFGLLIRWNLKPLLCVLFTSGLGGAILAIFIFNQILWLSRYSFFLNVYL